MPTIDNLGDIVQDLVESDPYTRRRIAQTVLKGGSTTVGNQDRGDHEINGAEVEE